MASLTHYNYLHRLANTRYSTPESLGITGSSHPYLPRIGEKIDPKYMHSSTPLQIKRAIDISCLVLSILGSAALITAAVLLKNSRIFYGLIATGIGAALSSCIALHHFSVIDLDSPKVREKETQTLRTHRLGLREINRRYPQGFTTVVSYALLGLQAPVTTYRQGAALAQRQAELDSFYHEETWEIKNAYSDATRPARVAAKSAQISHSIAMAQATDHNNPYPLLSAVHLATTAANSNEASRVLGQVEGQVLPLYNQAMKNLNAGYNREATANENNYRQLPLEAAAAPVEPSAPPLPPSYDEATADQKAAGF